MQTISVAFLLIFTCCSVQSEPYWMKRMNKYASLVNCQYYLTSEPDYKDFFTFNENATVRPEILHQIQFFTLTQQTIKFILSAGTESGLGHQSTTPTPFDPSSQPYYRTTSTTPSYFYLYGDSTTSTTPKLPLKSEGEVHSSADEPVYEFVIGAVTRKEVYSNGENCFKNYVETVIYRNNTNERLKSLATPNIILTDEPNYVIVDVYTNGRIVATINDQTEMETHIDDVDQLKYYAFASFEDRKRVEFFHNCNYTP